MIQLPRPHPALLFPRNFTESTSQTKSAGEIYEIVLQIVGPIVAGAVIVLLYGLWAKWRVRKYRAKVGMEDTAPRIGNVEEEGGEENR